MEQQLLIDALADWFADVSDFIVGVDIFVGDFPSGCGGPASCIRSTGGPSQQPPQTTATFQVMTRGKELPASMAFAQKLYDCIYPLPDRLPRRNVALSDTWTALAIDGIQPPYDLGVDEAGLRNVVFNITVHGHSN